MVIYKLAISNNEVVQLKESEWILCPICGNKTCDRVREDTVLENSPPFCPKCRQETRIGVKQMNRVSIFMIQHHRANPGERLQYPATGATGTAATQGAGCGQIKTPKVGSVLPTLGVDYLANPESRGLKHGLRGLLIIF